MTITVKFFALGRELIGKSAVTLDLPDDARVEDAITRLQAEHPSFAKLPSFVTAVNTLYTDRTALLNNNDELAIIPPVSGG